MDHTTSLKWVNAEVTQLLVRARRILEEIAEESTEVKKYALMKDELHQARLVLELLEVFGGALLLEEMENMTVALSQGRVTRLDDAHEVLMRALLQAPEYLEQIQTGRQDTALLLMPLLNDLRAVRRLGLFSANSLFSPDLSVEIDAPGESVLQKGSATPEAFAGYARKLRPYYQKGLVQWFKNTDAESGLKLMASVIAHLQKTCGKGSLGRLWFIGAGMIESLLDNGIHVSVTVKLLMAQFDQRIRDLASSPEQALLAPQPDDIYKNLLYYLSTSTSEGEKTANLRKIYKLTELAGGYPSDSEDVSLGPGLTVINTVNEAIKEDLASIQDTLDYFVRSESQSSADLESLVDKLNRVSDTLGLIGLGVPRKLIQKQSSIVSELVFTQTLPEQDVLMDIAGAVIEVGSVLDAVAAKGLEAAKVDTNQQRLSHQFAVMHEQDNLLSTVTNEAHTELAGVREAISAFLAEPQVTSHLENVDEHMARVQGTLEILSLPVAAAVVRGCARYVRDVLLSDTKALPDIEDIQNFADAIVGTEYYLEALSEKRTDANRILDLIQERLESLNIEVSTIIPEDNFDSGMQDENELPAPMPPNVAQNLREAKGLMQQIEQGDADQKPEEPLHKEVLEEKHELVDPEILEIFVEEVEEVLETIEQQLVRWRMDHDDEDALITVRRAFHTVKGSGRLVGAIDIGELAWSIERMLNRLIEHTAPFNPGILDLIKDVHQYLPVLLDAFQTGASLSDTEMQALVKRANEFESASPDDPEDDEDPPPGGSGGSDDSFSSDIKEDTSLQAENETSSSSPSNSLQHEQLDPASIPELDLDVHAADPVSEVASLEPETDFSESFIPRGFYDTGLHDILLIFISEAKGHLSVIQLNTVALPGEPLYVNEELMRASHTLSGAAKVSKLPHLSDIFAALEEMLGHYRHRHLSLQNAEQMLIQKCTSRLKKTLDSLPNGGGDMADDEKLIRQIHELSRWAEQQVIQRETSAEQHESSIDSVQELLAVFLEEAQELLSSCDNALLKWSEESDHKDTLDELQRQLHTLKGGARIAGLDEIGDVSHALESVLVEASKDRVPADNRLKNLIQDTQDNVADMIDIVLGGGELEPPQELLTRLEKAKQGDPGQQDETLSVVEKSAKKKSGSKSKVVSSQDEVTNTDVPVVSMIRPTPGRATHETLDDINSVDVSEKVQVKTTALDNLVNFAGEINISRSRLEQQIGEYKLGLGEMDGTVSRLREQLRSLEIETESQILSRHHNPENDEEFDPLELDRFSQIQQLARGLMESVVDLDSIRSILGDLARESESVLSQQSRVNSDLQQGLMNTRLIQVSRFIPRLRRLVRQTASELEKKVELYVEGEEIELDHTILGRMIAPLEHMLRNAVDHGMEVPRKRIKQGKAETGRIDLSFKLEGTEAVIRIQDDGHGLDIKAIRQKAIANGQLTPDEDIADKDLMKFVLTQSFSTSESVTQISGRGVGLDVVNNIVKQTGGSIALSSREGRGAQFEIRLPTTLSITHALMVMAGEDMFAIPLANIEAILQVQNDELQKYLQEEQPSLQHLGTEYPLVHLGSILGVASYDDRVKIKKRTPVLLVRSGPHQMALIVESLSGRQEIVIKPLGLQISSLAWIGGATILGDGSIVLLLDVPSLIRRESALPDQQQDRHADEQAVPLVMVVDDSITVRKVTQRFLARNGMQVLLAKDGVQALSLLQDHLPDVILLDVEMPRMDGYELATSVRNDERLKSLPIIMITSRTGKKHSDRAFEIGVNRYLGKPYHENELLESIHDFIPRMSAGSHG